MLNLTIHNDQWDTKIREYAASKLTTTLSSLNPPYPISIDDMLHITVSEPTHNKQHGNDCYVVTISISHVGGDDNYGYGGHEGTIQQPVISQSYEDAFMHHAVHNVSVIVDWFTNNEQNSIDPAGADSLSKRIQAIIDNIFDTDSLLQ